MFKRKNYLAPGAVTLVAALLLSLPSGAASRIKLATGGLFAPLFGAVSAAGQLPGAALDAVLPRSRLLKEIENLRRENQRLEVQNLQAAAILQENNQLRAQIGWQKQAPWQMKLARVILRDPANWWRMIEIDLGSRDGVRENLPVLTRYGLAGRVSSVGYARSQVVLVGDPGCRISARVVNPARDMGVVTTAGPLDSSLVNLTYLSGDAKLESGQKVVTSGEGGIFPPGILVGQIVDSSQVENGLYTEARVKVSADLGSLEEVWILFP
jgi:rod shape-determining protein MreC